MATTSDDPQRQWDQRYGSEGYVFGIDPNRFVAEQLGDTPPGRALDLGSGQGRNAVWLALRGHDVTAVDLSPVATKQAAQLAEDAGVTVDFVAADLATWEPPAGAYDLVLLSYLQLPPPLRQRVHSIAIDALAGGGKLFLIAHHLDNIEHGIGGPQYPEANFTEELLAADFADLVIDRLEKVMRPVDKPDLKGVAIDVMLVAHKPGSRPTS